MRLQRNNRLIKILSNKKKKLENPKIILYSSEWRNTQTKDRLIFRSTTKMILIYHNNTGIRDHLFSIFIENIVYISWLASCQKCLRIYRPRSPDSQKSEESRVKPRYWYEELSLVCRSPVAYRTGQWLV